MLANFYEKNRIRIGIIIFLIVLSAMLILFMYKYFMVIENKSLFDIARSPLNRIFLSTDIAFNWYQLYA
ncbi:MAG: hypothetical protein ACOC6D_05615, partial [Atribacterota bacterium]